MPQMPLASPTDRPQIPPRLLSSLILGAFALIVLWMSAFTLDQRAIAIVFQFGEISRTLSEPGLHFKLPLVQSVRYFDQRIQTLDANKSELFQTIEKENLLVDSFAKWKIADPIGFYRAFGGSMTTATQRLNDTINSALRAEFGKKKAEDVISGKRDEVMENVRKTVDAASAETGIRLVDLRLKRVDFPPEISVSVYRRMESERKTVASRARSEGSAEAQRIRADADKRREVILANAYKKAQQLKGEGDAQAARIYGAAGNQNPEFYAFYRSLEAYRESFGKGGGASSVMVLEPNSDFFRYLNDPQGRRP